MSGGAAPSRLYLPWLRVAELSRAVREAAYALRAGKPDLALELLTRVEHP